MKKLIVLITFLLFMFLLKACSTCPVPKQEVKEIIKVKKIEVVKYKIKWMIKEHKNIDYPYVPIGLGCTELKNSFEQCYSIIKKHNHLN